MPLQAVFDVYPFYMELPRSTISDAIYECVSSCNFKEEKKHAAEWGVQEKIQFQALRWMG